MLFAILVSIAAGVTVVVSRNINSLLAEKEGLFVSTFFNYLTGVFFSMVFLFFSSETLRLSADTLGQIPVWAYLGGLLGVVVVTLSNYITPQISAFYMTLIIFIGQLFTGILIDWFALHILSAGKLIGGLLVLLGLACNLYFDMKANRA